MKSTHTVISVPLYGAAIELIVCDDIGKVKPRLFGLKGDFSKNTGYYGLSAYSFPHFGIFLQRKLLTHDTIAHEIFHTTHRILESIDTPFQPNCCEPYAYLNGYITGEVYSFIKKAKIKVL